MFSIELRSKLKLGIRHDAILHSWNIGYNQGEIKLMLKADDKNDEESKLIGMSACEDNASKLTTNIKENS